MDLERLQIIGVSIDEAECLCDQFCVKYVPGVFSPSNEGLATKVMCKSLDVLELEKDAILLAAGMCSPSAIKLELSGGETIDGNTQVLLDFVSAKGT